jgi:hypothetical protein
MTKQVTLLKWIKRREKFRKLGRLKFSIIIGFIQGVAFALCKAPLDWLFYSKEYNIKSLINEFLSLHTLYAFLFFVIFIILFNYFYSWNQMEKQYQKWIKERDKVSQ